MLKRTQMNLAGHLWSKQLVLIIFSNMILFFGFQLITLTLPLHVKSLGAADHIVGWVNGVFTLAALFIRPVAGSSLDRFGRRGVFLSGLLVFFACTLSFGALPAIPLILLLRFIQGFGWGTCNTAINTVASDCIPRERFGEGMGYFTLAGNISMAAAPAIGLYMIASSGFRSVSFLAAGLVGAVAVLSVFLKYKEVSKEKVRSRRALFEKTSVHPAVSMFFVTVTYGALNSFLALHALQQGVEQTGLLFAVVALSMVVSRPIAGKIADRCGVKKVVAPGLFFLFIATVVFSAAGSLNLFLCASVFYGLGFGSAQAGFQSLSVIRAPKENIGLANSTFFIGFDSGIGVGSVLLGILAGYVGYSRMFFYSSLSIGASAVYSFVAQRKV